jgi:hypothetical protein
VTAVSGYPKVPLMSPREQAPVLSHRCSTKRPATLASTERIVRRW